VARAAVGVNTVGQVGVVGTVRARSEVHVVGVIPVVDAAGAGGHHTGFAGPVGVLLPDPVYLTRILLRRVTHSRPPGSV
jgi:hypothetical protein